MTGYKGGEGEHRDLAYTLNVMYRPSRQHLFATNGRAQIVMVIQAGAKTTTQHMLLDKTRKGH